MSERVINVRYANYEDFKKIVQWSTVECDWELCAEDFLVWKRYIPCESFMVAEDEKGNITGFIAALKYAERNTGQISMFYVKENCRGQGFGGKLFERAAQYLNGMNIFLCSEPEMMDKYRNRSGFKFAYDWDALDAVGKPVKFKSFIDSISTDNNITVTLASDEHIQDVLTYDEKISNLDRKSWCKNWLLVHPVGVSVVAHENSKVVGYGSVRVFRKYNLKLEPIYADSELIARKIIAHLLSLFSNVEEREIRFFFRSTDEKMKRIVNDLGLKSPYSLTFMFTKHIVDDIDFCKVFCLSGCDVNFII